MNKHILNICLLLLCFAGNSKVQAQKLSWSPKVPVSGQQMELIYDPRGGDLEFSDQVNASIICFQDYKWKSSNLTLSKVDDHWTASYVLPAHTVFAAVKFFQGTAEKVEATDNNNGQGFYTPVLAANKKVAPGTYFAEAQLISSVNNMALSGYANPSKHAGRIDTLLEKEAAIKGSALDSYLTAYLDLKKSTMEEAKFKSFADQVLQKQLNSKKADEQLLAGIQRYYAHNLRLPEQALQVEEMILRRYPHGSAARFIIYERTMKEKTPEGYRAAAEKFLQDFPYREWKQHPDHQAFLYYAVHRGISENYYEHGQYDQFLKLFRDFDFKTANEVYRWNLTRAEMQGRKDKKVLFELSGKIIPYLVERRTDGSYREDFGGDRQKEQENADDQLNDRLFTHISLAYATKNYEDALGSFRYLSAKGQYGNADLNAMHMNMLKETGDTRGVAALLEASVKANAVTPAMFNEMKQLYMDQHKGSTEGYEKYLSALMPEDKKAEMRAHVMANMVNYPLPPFTLESASGRFVSSAEWKDKIVVIDFWATWCRPCIMAFPGMQLLIDQYANDPKVAVYMIGTMQNGDYKTKSVNYVKSQGYRFNLLHDAVSADGEQSAVFRSLAPLFKSSGIPRKIIVKNGIVRYSSEGYGGSPSELRDELAMAIEILRGEK